MMDLKGKGAYEEEKPGQAEPGAGSGFRVQSSKLKNPLSGPMVFNNPDEEGPRGQGSEGSRVKAKDN